MAIRYELPTAADFDKLSGDREVAVSVYVETSPTHFDGDHARVTFKSACDDALNQLEAAGVDRAVRMQIDKLRDEIAESKGEPWTKLSRSLAVFLAPGFSEVFVLPSRLETHFDAGTAFQDAGQLAHRRIADVVRIDNADIGRPGTAAVLRSNGIPKCSNSYTLFAA